MSKLMMFDFECPEGHQFEELVQPEVKHLECPQCKQEAMRLVAAGHLDYLHMGVDVDMTTAADKWAKMQ